MTAARSSAKIAAVQKWRVTFDRKKGFHTHVLEGALGPELVVPVVASFFSTLRVGASITNGEFWWTIHAAPSLVGFEAEHGADAERAAYNVRGMEEAKKTGRLVRGTHTGYSDLFVPIIAKGDVVGILITGPFAPARASAADVIGRWRDLTGRQGHPADPEFAVYLSMTLGTLVLTQAERAAFEDLVGILAKLLGGEGPADELATRAEARHMDLWNVRGVERVWEAASSMIDDRFPRDWHSLGRVDQLRVLGLSRVPDHVLVGLTESQKTTSDPVDEAVRRDAFQRRVVELARRHGETVVGRVGDHGVAFLSSAAGSLEAKKRRLVELAERTTELARRHFGLRLRYGASVSKESLPLARAHQLALGAAESALEEDAKIVFATSEAVRPTQALARLREALARNPVERAGELPVRFDRYLEAVAQQSGYRFELARVHLEFGFERAAESLVGSGALDAKSFASMREGLERAAASAPTLRELFDAYRLVVRDIAAGVERPRPSDQERSLRRAIDFMRQRYTESLRLGQVARVAGFAPDYFTRLFKKHEGVTFERYLRELRVERAKQLLTGTPLDVNRVAELAGFSSAQYFCHVFKADVGVTPLAYRRHPRREKARATKRKRKRS